MNSPLGTEWGKDVFLFSLARHALLEGLRMAGVRGGDAVMLPEFICRELLASIHLAGARSILYPVDDCLRPVSFPEVEKVKAVLAVDYFGFPQDLEPFRTLCLNHGAVLLEDNAHGFLSRDAAGQLLGRRGDMGILSLRKTFSLPDGGALVFNRPFPDIERPHPLPFRNDPLPFSYRLKSRLRDVQLHTGLPLKTAGENAIRLARQLRTGEPFPKSAPDCESVIPMAPPMHAESYRLLGTQNIDREVERRRRLYGEVRDRLRHLPVSPVFPSLQTGTVPYGYPFRAEPSVARKVATLARGLGFDCPLWPELPESIASSAPPHYRNIYWVNFLC